MGLTVEPRALQAPSIETPSLETATPKGSGAGAASGSGGFAKLLANVVGEANHDIHHAEDQARKLAEGKAGIVETVLAMNKADMSLRYVVELRNRFVEAYREISRISG